MTTSTIRMMKSQIAGETKARLAAETRARDEEVRADAAEKRERELHAELSKLRVRVSEVEAVVVSSGMAT